MFNFNNMLLARAMPFMMSHPAYGGVFGGEGHFGGGYDGGNGYGGGHALSQFMPPQAPQTPPWASYQGMQQPWHDQMQPMQSPMPQQDHQGFGNGTRQAMPQPAMMAPPQYNAGFGGAF